jgi:hypothetical protein
MEFIAITQQTCSWLLAHPDIVAALHGVIVTEHVDSLRKSEFASGPLRMAGSEDGKVLAIWNREYLSGTGSEAWGVFKLRGAHSLTAQLAISQQVFERTIYVINHRLQGLLLDGDLIHRPWANGSHTCLAGRGTEARQFSIAYFEEGPGYAELSSKAIFSIGPEHDFTKLQQAIDAELRNFAPAVLAANKIIDAQRRRPLLEAPALQELRSAVLSGRDSSIASSVTVSANFSNAFEAKAYETLHWDYSRWVGSGALNETQRRVLDADALARHPLRIMGPAGSGKTLLMQLLSIKYLKAAEAERRELRVLYLVHNAAMAQSVIDRFRVLGAEEYLTRKDQSLVVVTLSEYGRVLIGISESSIIDKDAQKTKVFQLELIKAALKEALEANKKLRSESDLLMEVNRNQRYSIYSHIC